MQTNQPKAPSSCEICTFPAMINLKGKQWLCWNHYCEAMQKFTDMVQPEPPSGEQTAKRTLQRRQRRLAAIIYNDLQNYLSGCERALVPRQSIEVIVQSILKSEAFHGTK